MDLRVIATGSLVVEKADGSLEVLKFDPETGMVNFEKYIKSPVDGLRPARPADMESFINRILAAK